MEKMLKKLTHLLLGHEWTEIDVFEFGRTHYIAVNESNFRYYKCRCGKQVREHSQKLMQMPHPSPTNYQ